MGFLVNSSSFGAKVSLPQALNNPFLPSIGFADLYLHLESNLRPCFSNSMADRKLLPLRHL